MANRRVPIYALLGFTFAGLLMLSISAAIFAGAYFLEKSLHKEISSQAEARAEILSQVLEQNLANGYFPLIVQMCERLIGRDDVLGVEVKTNDGFVVYSKHPPEGSDSVEVASEIRLTSIDASSPKLGAVRIWIDFSRFASIIKAERQVALLFLIGLMFCIGGIVFWIHRIISRPLQELARLLKSGVVNDLSDVKLGGTSQKIRELDYLYSGTRTLARTNMEYESKLIQAARKEAVVELARQVAHDIRSPLTAINFALGTGVDFNEDRTSLIKSAINRINEISDNLLSQSKGMNRSNVSTSSAKTVLEDLKPLIESIVREKQVEYSIRSSIVICSSVESSRDLTALVNSCELKRALSNLINNSVEALDSIGSGKVEVKLMEAENNSVIQVSDNGKGIPAHILPLLGQSGQSHGKSDSTAGSGLGLHHARTSVESWGGQLAIESAEGVGTRVVITLPNFDSNRVIQENQQL